MRYLFIVICMLLACQAFAGNDNICFYNYHTEEVLETNYRKSPKEIQHIFRSRSDDKEISIDIKLLELLDRIQDHFGADCIELISGYRSPELNRQLKKEGANVAEESMHLEGKAADIHIDEVTEETLVEYVRGLKIGGVGYYPAFNFVHVDTGDVRKWDLPDKPGRLLTAFRKGAIWQIMTDRDIYTPDESISYELMNITRTGKISNGEIELQIFKRGKWTTLRKFETCKLKGERGSGKACAAEWKPEGNDPYGKYRMTISGAYSNEFYRKNSWLNQ